MKQQQTKQRQTGRRSRIVKKWDGSSVPVAQFLKPSQAGSLRTLRAQFEASPEDPKACLALAECLLGREKPAEVIELLTRRWAMVPAGTNDTVHWRAVRCLALAFLKQGCYAEAQRHAERGAEALPGSLDFHHLLSYIGQMTDDQRLSAAHARAYLALVQKPPEDRDPCFWQTLGLVHEVQNYLGAALEKEGHIDAAMESYENALLTRPTFDFAWANLIRLLQKVGRESDAVAVAQKAHQACPRSKVLPKLRRSRTPRAQAPVSDAGAVPTIALCMIVKNEEEHLARCLASARPLVDHLIVVDTGSTDRTVEIAQSFGATIHHHEWEGNFSKARNISMGYADTDWIFILDADEELDARDVALIRDTVRTTDFKAISVSVYNYSAQKRMYTSFLPSVRLFRRDLGAFYEGIVHNQLRIPGYEGVLRIPARINHYGYGLAPEVMARKAMRTRALLEQQLRENPDNGFAHFNLAQLLRGSEDTTASSMMDRVIFHAGRAVELSSPDDPNQRHVHLMALHQLVTAYFNKGDYNRAAAEAHRALALKPGYLDAILSLGHIHSMDGKFELARKYYLEYLDRQKSYDEHMEVDHVILLHLRSRHNALYGLGLVAEMQGDWREAMVWYERCVAEREDYLDTHFRLGTAHLQFGEKAKAREALQRELGFHSTNSDARLALAELLLQEGSEADAITCLREGIKVQPGDAALNLRMAELEFRRRDFTTAQEHLNAIDPGDRLHSRARHLSADIAYELKHYPEAIVLYEECLKRQPDNWDVINNLGNCRFRTGDYVAAEVLYRRIIDVGRADKHVYRNLGVTLARMERIDDAVFALESYAEMEPDDIESAGFLGDLHYGRRDYSRAIDEYEKVLEMQPQRPDTLTRLGDCYLNRGAIAAALVGYERALAADPEYRPAWDRLREIRGYLVARIREGNRGAGDETSHSGESDGGLG